MKGINQIVHIRLYTVKQVWYFWVIAVHHMVHQMTLWWIHQTQLNMSILYLGETHCNCIGFGGVRRCILQSMSQNYHSVRCLTVSVVPVWDLSFGEMFTISVFFVCELLFGEVSCSRCGPCLAVFNITKILLTAPNVMFYTSQELRQEVPSSGCRSVSLWVCSH